MRDDERLFSFGLRFFALTLVAVAVFHAAFNMDEKKLGAKNKIIRALEQDNENAKGRFADLVRPDILRPIVMRIHPSYRHIGTGRTQSAGSLEQDDSSRR